jgi:hypothetical protein
LYDYIKLLFLFKYYIFKHNIKYIIELKNIIPDCLITFLQEKNVPSPMIESESESPLSNEEREGGKIMN